MTLRRLPLDQPVPILVAERLRVRKGFEDPVGAIRRRDHDALKEILSDVEGTFKQHIGDEEA